MSQKKLISKMSRLPPPDKPHLIGYKPGQKIPYGAKPSSVGVYKISKGTYYAEPNITQKGKNRYTGETSKS